MSSSTTSTCTSIVVDLEQRDDDFELSPAALRKRSPDDALRLMKMQLDRMLVVLAVIMSQPWHSQLVVMPHIARAVQEIVNGDVDESHIWDHDGFYLPSLGKMLIPPLDWKTGHEDDPRMIPNFKQSRFYEIFQRTANLLENTLIHHCVTFRDEVQKNRLFAPTRLGIFRLASLFDCDPIVHALAAMII